jgi:quercetin dioxygenase-like cupin family protein
MDEQQFRSVLAKNEYDCKEFGMPANTHNPEHSHPWHARLLILEGELTLITPQGEHTYHAGDSCELEAGTVHSERVGRGEMRGLLGTKQP